MGYQNVQPSRETVWALAASQHGVVTRSQLLHLGLRSQAIKHRVGKGRLHAVHRGVFALGRPELTQRGRWMAAVLACGPGAALSHASGAAALGIEIRESPGIEVSVPRERSPRRPGIVVHRRTCIGPVKVRDGIPITTPTCTIVDLALRLDRAGIERLLNEAVAHGLVEIEELRAALDGELAGRPGAGRLRETLDRRTFVLTDSELERRFLPIARAAGLSRPKTRASVNGFRVDFHWPEIGLVVETDGARFHSTAVHQTRDRLRDQAHVANGLTPLRFTHAQVRFTPDHVRRTLAAVARRLEPGRA